MDRGALLTSFHQDRVSSTSVPLIEPAHIVSLPKSQAFALIEGGNLWMVRMPLPAPDPDEVMPKDLQTLAEQMRKGYCDGGGQWWTAPASRKLPEDLPADLLDSGNLSNQPAE